MTIENVKSINYLMKRGRYESRTQIIALNDDALVEGAHNLILLIFNNSPARV